MSADRPTTTADLDQRDRMLSRPPAIRLEAQPQGDDA